MGGEVECGVSVSVPLAQREGSTVSRPNSFLFRSSTRSNIRASSVVSPMSPQSPTFPEPDPNVVVRQRVPEEGPDDLELVFQLRKVPGYPYPLPTVWTIPKEQEGWDKGRETLIIQAVGLS
ncbi:hypothetical protein chiPu_0028093 [Chiloscyllium punctatum]|uniref:Uncharacterized protein n=1 Tax=Chiloscyllium punctatum TaxID=137246 RepID=A0A401TNA1_CHIPU|nr:hypothetical protein [Chiloscyllium punctatum]